MSPAGLSRRTVLERLVDLATIAAALAVVWLVLHSMLSRPARAVGQPPVPALPANPISMKDVPRQGADSARLGMVAFSDFQCPFCKKFAVEVLPVLLDEYVSQGKLMIGFKHSPLPNHPFAERAAEFAGCANSQGLFWQMHDAIFASGSDLSERALFRVASNLRLDRRKLDDCLVGEAVLSRVQTDASEAKRLGVTSTPTFFLGTVRSDGGIQVEKVLLGARPVAEFREALDDIGRLLALGQKQPSRSAGRRRYQGSWFSSEFSK